MFEMSHYNVEEQAILNEFFERRKVNEAYVKSHNLSICPCPCCGLPTIHERNTYEICKVCDWEDDGQDDEDADKVSGGPNGDISLSQSRIQIGKELRLNGIPDIDLPD